MKQQRRQRENDDGQSKLEALGDERLVIELRLALARADDVSKEMQRRRGHVRKKTGGVDPRYLTVGSPEWHRMNGTS